MTDHTTMPKPLDCVLVANRGEIARRIIRTCTAMGITTVAVFSDADADAPYVREADRSVRLPGTAPADTYLRVDLLIAAARKHGAQAIHPGYGFLAERPDAAQSVMEAGLIWIGPSPDAIASMGSKIGAKALMRAAGVPVLADSTVESYDEIGVPALVKASAGGGGRGMRIVRSSTELATAVASAEREAYAAFGDGTVFVERYVEGGRHVEVQVFADRFGTTVSLFERDCTLQRRHKKILEESPSPAVDDELRARMGDAARAAARAVDYVGAGTVEFLLGPDGDFWFLEMNTRLQVEHPVTEMTTGLDLVELQLLVAAGEPLPPSAVDPRRDGHAIEVRLCAEDPTNGYLPSSGVFRAVQFPAIDGVRIDSGIESGSVVTPHYDSMVAKVIAHAPTRRAAARKLVAALEQATIIGPVTNRDQLITLAASLETIDAPGASTIDTGYLDRTPPTAPPPLDPVTVATAALAVIDEHDRRRTVLGTTPPGWRNLASQRFEQRLDDHLITYRRTRSGLVTDIEVDGQQVDTQEARDLARHRPPVLAESPDGLTVHLLGGRRTLTVTPRFRLPGGTHRAGSLVAPMPGAVLRVLVEVGDVVCAGQALVTLEAMKMEHQITAPHDGHVAELFVRTGQQLDTGQVLARIEAPADTDEAP